MTERNWQRLTLGTTHGVQSRRPHPGRHRLTCFHHEFGLQTRELALARRLFGLRTRGHLRYRRCPGRRRGAPALPRLGRLEAVLRRLRRRPDHRKDRTTARVTRFIPEGRAPDGAASTSPTAHGRLAGAI